MERRLIHRSSADLRRAEARRHEGAVEFASSILTGVALQEGY